MMTIRPDDVAVVMEHVECHGCRAPFIVDRRCIKAFRTDIEKGPRLIWSNEHRMWWRAGRSGYTQYIEEAGVYPYKVAAGIVANSTVDRQLFTERTDPVTGELYRCMSEVMVPVPS